MNQILPRFAFLATTFFVGGVLPSSAQTPPTSTLFTQWQANPETATLPDFGMSGFAGGEQKPPQLSNREAPVFHVADYGALPDDAAEDRAGIQKAIDAATLAGGGIVQLAPGQYIVNSDGKGYPLWIRSGNVVIRGSGRGEGGTLLYSPQKFAWELCQWVTMPMFTFAPSHLQGIEVIYGEHHTGTAGTRDYYDGEWANDSFHPAPQAYLATGLSNCSRGSYTAEVSHPERFRPGDAVFMTVRDKLVAADLVAPWDYRWFFILDQDAYAFDPWAIREHFLRQMRTVVSVAGNTVTFAEPAYAEFKSQYEICFIRASHMENTALENLRAEVVVTPRADRWDANGFGTIMTGARNSWARDLTYHNMQSGLNLGVGIHNEGQSMSITGLPFHDSFKFLGTYNSLMRDVEVANFTVDPETNKVDSTDHGLSVQDAPMGNVYLDGILPRNGNIDIHTGPPLANLYDRIKGGRHAESGGFALAFHASHRMTFWNWETKLDATGTTFPTSGSAKGKYQFPVFTGKQTVPYSSWSIHLAQPIVVGLHNHPDYNTVPAVVQFTETHNFATTPVFNDNGAANPRVTVERTGTRVAPDSLYLAQRDKRLLDRYNKSTPEAGIWIAIAGPNRVLTGASHTLDFSASRSEYPLAYTVSIDGGDWQNVTASTYPFSFNEAGPHTIRVQAVSSKGGTVRREWRVWAFEANGQILPSLAQYSARPESFTLTDVGHLWQADLLDDYTTNSWVSGGEFGLINTVKDSARVFGGTLTTALTDVGIDLTGASIRAEIETTILGGSEAPRIIACDADGDWAMLDATMNNGVNQLSADGSWIAPFAQMGLQSGSFDKTRVTRIGIIRLMLNRSANVNTWIIRLKDFAVQKGASSAPSIAITAPVGGVSTGHAVPFTVSTSDAQTSVTRVQYFIDGHPLKTLTSAPFSTTWYPSAAGNAQLTARAWDTGGNFADSSPVNITVSAASGGSAPTLASPGNLSFEIGRAVDVTLSAPGATAFSATGLPAGLVLENGSGRLYGVPTQSQSGNLTITARNAAGSSASVVVTTSVAPPAALAVALSSSPVLTASTSSTVTLTATVTGSATSVQFYNGAVLLGTDTSAPYSFSWVNPPAGAHTLTARAIGGSTVTSAPLALTVLPASPSPVTVAVTSPAAASTFVGAPQIINVGAALSDPDGRITRVDLYNNSTRLGQMTYNSGTGLYGYSWNASFGYGHSLRAVAYTADGASFLSTGVPLVVSHSQRPSVAITAPAAASSIQLGETILLRGTAADSDGTIARIEIWSGSGGLGDAVVDTKLGNATYTASTGTWTYRVINPPSGPQHYYAIAYDVAGDSRITPVLTLRVSAIFSPIPLYGDAANYTQMLSATNRWDLGEFGGDVRLLTRARSGYNYTYDNTLPASDYEHFRLTGKFRAPDYPELSSEQYPPFAFIQFGNCIFFLDDAPGQSSDQSGSRLVYINGQYRIPLAYGPTAGINTSNWIEFELTRIGTRVTLKLNGATWIDLNAASGSTAAREFLKRGPVIIGNDRLSGCNLMWDDLNVVSLDATGTPIVATPTSVALTAPANQAILPTGGTVTVTGSVSDADGIASVEIFSGATKLGNATVSSGTFSYSWSGASLGVYALAAKVTDNLGNPTWSPVVNVTLQPGGGGTNAAPSIAITGPAANSEYTFGLPVALSGTCSDSDGSVESILIFANGQCVGGATVTGGTWNFALPAMTPGTWQITAKAIDDRGGSTTSPSLPVVFLPNTPPGIAFVTPDDGATPISSADLLLSVTASDTDGTVNKVEFFENDRLIGLGANNAGTWSFTWRPRILGSHTLRARATDSHGARTEAATRTITVIPDPDPLINRVAYVGGTGEQRFEDVLKLSDGTWLVAGSASDLAWTSAPKTELNPLALPNGATGQTAFLAQIAADWSSILSVVHLPAGQVTNFKFLKTTSKPGAATGQILVSGQLDGTEKYFIAKLNNNFVAGTPTALSWAVTATPTSNTLGLQPWDVAADGSVIYATSGTTNGSSVQQVKFLDASGNPRGVTNLRGTHWENGVEQLAAETDNPGTQVGVVGNTLSGGPDVSAISFPRDLRSWSNADRNAILPDGNGSIKKGTWPHDLYWPAQQINGADYGYTGYQFAGGIRIGGITIDRDTGDFYIGFNQQSKFWDAPANKNQPDFEPAVIAYSGTGTLKWWSRLYHEVVDANANGQIDAGETRLSSPDQYVDGLALDYSASPARLVVAARCHGNNVSNFWSGNAVAANPAAQGFQNKFTGTEGNVHISWLGKLSATDGTLQAASFVAGYFRDATLTQNTYAEPIHDNWPSHNFGNPNLTTTRIDPGSVRVDPAGRVYIVGVGPRLVTTFNAYQKQSRKTNTENEGVASWAAFVRVFEPDLSSLAYSSLLTGTWSSTGDNQPIGGDNTELQSVYPDTNGLITVGWHMADTGVAKGQPIATVNEPAWGRATPDNVTAIIGKLSFASNRNIAPSASLVSPANNAFVTPGQAVTLTASSSDFDGLVTGVEFFLNGTSLGIDTTSPYEAVWTPPSVAGTYTWFVRATDDEGAVTTSASRALKISLDGVNILPTVEVLSPADGASFPTSATIELSAQAADSDGSITRVEFYLNDQKYGEALSAPFNLLLSNFSDGDYSFHAIAFDNKGDSSTSGTVQFHVGGSPGITTAAVAFAKTSVNDVPNGGLFWNGTGSTSLLPSLEALRAIDGSLYTDISLSVPSGFSHFSLGRGIDHAITVDGYNVPQTVGGSSLADNTSGSDGYAVVRLTSPTKYRYYLTVISGRAYQNPADGIHVAHYNVGGTYNAATKTFSGGQTITLDASKGDANYDTGVLTALDPVEVDGVWTLDLQCGVSAANASATIYLNALHIVALPIVDGNAPPRLPFIANREIEDFDNNGFVSLTLDASAATDSDGEIVSYVWKENAETLATTALANLNLPVGTHYLDLTVTDDSNAESTQRVTVNILPYRGGAAPVGVAGSDQTVLAGPGGTANASLNGSASYDTGEGGAIASYQWRSGATVLASVASPTIALAPGIHTLTLRVTDNSGLTGEDTVQITVNAFAADPVQVQLNFTDGTDGTASYGTIGGSTWNTLVSRSDTPINTDPDLANLRKSDGTPSSIAFTWRDGFAFASGSRGENGTTSLTGTATDGLSTYDSAGLTTVDGAKSFPWDVVKSYGGVASDTDGYAAFTLSSDLPLTYTFWVLSSYDHTNPTSALTEFNIGGTVSGVSGNRVTFTGGTTLSLNGASNQGADDKQDSSESLTYSLKYKVAKLTASTTTEAQWNASTGKYELTIQIGDADSSTAAAYLNGLIIVATPLPPVAAAGADQAVQPLSGGTAQVALDGTGSFARLDGVTIAKFEWLREGAVLATGATPTVSLAQGVHTLTLRVTDTVGLTGEDTVQITVTNTAPTVTITGPNLDAISLPDRTDSLVLTATATDAEVTPTVTWSQVSGPGTTTFANASSSSISATFSTNGTYVLRATASDGLLTATDEITVGVETALGGVGPAKVVQLDLSDVAAPSVAQIGSSGYWVTVDGESSAKGDVADLKDSANAATGISLTWTNLSGFQSGSRAEGGTGSAGTATDGLSTWTAASVTGSTTSGVTFTDGGKYFPWSVIRSYCADSSGNLMALTLASATQRAYTFWVMSSYDHNNPATPNFRGLFNVGGTYASGSFTGGTTLTLDAPKQQAATDSLLDSNETGGSVKYHAGKLATQASTYNATSGKYEITFQAGAATATTAGVYLNGLIIQSAEITNAGEAPRVNPGTAPAASVGVAASLSGTASDDGGTPTVTWSLVSGPGTATFANANAAATSVTFSAPGSYVLRLSATDGTATVHEDLTVTVTGETFASWISGFSVGGLTAAAEDADADGLANLIEYALGTDPSDPFDRSDLTVGISGDKLTLTFTPQRLDGLTYVVQAGSDLVTWTDTTLTGLTVGQPHTHTDGTALGSGTPKRFLRLKIIQP